ncbi:MAG: ABC transporter transmembrane domain-containing protein, partial [Acidimicrobiales bacterium]|nr:ABC transporter transmembrane domain-containing protein [Acidimicrobiales bacterium]
MSALAAGRANATSDLEHRSVTRFEPLAVTPRYPPPQASPDPDPTKGWIRRIWPIVWAHKRLFIVSITAAVIAMLISVTVPVLTASAINQALVRRSVPLEPFAVALIALGVGRGFLSFCYRYGLYKMAYRIETDLRALIYRHLTRLSFSFFDRVQSGQIISRANSDIRSVQMFLAFAPLITISIMMFFFALAIMLTISVPLTLASVLTLPPVYLLGVRLRAKLFPLS